MSLVIDFEDSRHRQVERELPWYLNGTLAEPVRARVEQHLAGCSRCRREEARMRQEERALAAPLPFAPPPERFAALRARLDAPVADAAQPRRRAAARPWLLAVAAAQAALLLWWLPATHPTPAAGFHTLGNARGSEAGPGEVRVLMMLRPEATQAAARRLLHENGARIVDGPNAAGAYLVALPAADASPALATLRASPEVLLLQRIDAPDPARR